MGYNRFIMKRLLFILLCFPLVYLVRSECQVCDPSICDPPRNCWSGLVKDSCSCCYVCGRKEGERCDHDSLTDRGFGTCGDNLECRMRTDLDDDDPEEATCICVYSYHICGSDGNTYENVCQFTEARYRLRNGLRAISREPCISAPEMVTSPKTTGNSTGSTINLMCDAIGWPLPTIAWYVSTAPGQSVQLPVNEDSRVSVRSATGPGITEVTSWLYISQLSNEHEGSYACSVSNDYGVVTEYAYVYVYNT